MPSKDRVKKEANREWRETNKLKISAKNRLIYHSNPSPQKAAAGEFPRRSFALNQEPKRAAPRKASKVSFAHNPEPKRAAARKASKPCYKNNPLTKRAASVVYYSKKRLQKLCSWKNYHANREFLCFARRGRYSLSEPKLTIKYAYIKQVQKKLLDYPCLVTKLCAAFTCVNEKAARAVSAKILRSTT